MELHPINQYPVLSRPDQLKLAPPRHIIPGSQYQEQMSPHYNRLAPNQGVPSANPIGQRPMHQMPSHQFDNSAHNTAHLRFTTNNSLNQPSQTHNLSVPPQNTPYQHYGQLPQRHPQTYPLSHPHQPLPYASPYNGTEYYNEFSQPLYLTQQTENQNIATKYAELEKQSQSFKCVSYIHRCLAFLAGLGMIGLFILLVFSEELSEICDEFSSDRKVNSCYSFFSRVNEPEFMPIAFAALMFSILVMVFHKFGLQVYIRRRARAMNSLHYVYIVLLVLNALTLDPVSIAIFGYLAHASARLRKIFKEMEEIKFQLEAQGIDVKNLSTTISV